MKIPLGKLYELHYIFGFEDRLWNLGNLFQTLICLWEEISWFVYYELLLILDPGSAPWHALGVSATRQNVNLSKLKIKQKITTFSTSHRFCSIILKNMAFFLNTTQKMPVSLKSFTRNVILYNGFHQFGQSLFTFTCQKAWQITSCWVHFSTKFMVTFKNNHPNLKFENILEWRTQQSLAIWGGKVKWR